MPRMAIQMHSDVMTTERQMNDHPAATEPTETPALRSSVTLSPLGLPISGVMLGAFWRDYATARKDFESIQSELDSSSASLDSMYRDLTESSCAESEDCSTPIEG